MGRMWRDVRYYKCLKTRTVFVVMIHDTLIEKKVCLSVSALRRSCFVTNVRIQFKISWIITCMLYTVYSLKHIDINFVYFRLFMSILL